MPRRRGRPRYPDLLTPAEWRVVDCVRHGQGNREIASRLGVSVDAVKFHVGNALSKLGFHSRHQLQRWNGVPRASPLYREQPGATTMVDQLGPIGQLSRIVGDIVAATRWYREVLRLPYLFSSGDFAFFDCGGVRLFLSAGATTGGQSIIYFRVDDIQHTSQDLASRGVEFINAPHRVHTHEDGTEEWMAFFKDLDGEPLALLCQVAAPNGNRVN